MRNKLIYIFGFIILALAGYFYLSMADTEVVGEEPAITPPNFIDPKEILKYDPDAPEWMKNAESCSWVGKKIFCKLKGE
mgnify:FL=1